MNIKQLLNHQIDGPTYASLYSLRGIIRDLFKVYINCYKSIYFKKDNLSLIQKFNLAKRLQVHRGCVRND